VINEFGTKGEGKEGEENPTPLSNFVEMGGKKKEEEGKRIARHVGSWGGRRGGEGGKEESSFFPGQKGKKKIANSALCVKGKKKRGGEGGKKRAVGMVPLINITCLGEGSVRGGRGEEEGRS